MVHLMKQTLLALCLSFGLALAAPAAEVEFLGLDLGPDDRLLFTARLGLHGGGSYDSLFAAQAGTGEIRQLTFYPEYVALVDGGRRLEVQNRYGVFRSDTAFENLEPIPGFPAFVRGAPVSSSRLLPSQASPDGSWLLAAQPTGAAYARLVLFDTKSGASTTIAEDLEYSIERFPARWSPDSRHIVYGKRGSLFYFSVDQLSGNRVLGEDFRRIGEGRIASAKWGKDGSLYYLRGASLFRIMPAEFFTQALYRGLAGMGTLAGKIPFPFDPSFDEFWVSSDGTRLILSKAGRSLFLLYLDPDDFGAAARVVAVPHLYLQGNTIVRELFWPSRGPVTVFTGSLLGEARSAGAYRFFAPQDPRELDLAPAVSALDVEGANALVMSPDESRIAVVRPSGVLVRNYEDWSLRVEVKASGTLHCLWNGEARLIVAGSSRIENVDLARGTRSLVALSQVESFGRQTEGAGLAAMSAGLVYERALPDFATSASTGTPAAAAGSVPAGAAGGQAPLVQAWRAASTYKVQPASPSSERYRAYLESLSSGPYRNLVMLRSVQGLGTRSLFPRPSASYAPFPERDEPRGGSVFDRGSRIRRRELALTFDALESAEGLAKVLDVLRDYGLRATFFVNGEFVRREPGASRLLAASGHEIGSMFFTTADPTDARYRVDRDYIRRGLGRAEDDWFAATGKELSLLWHSPYYTANDEILEAGASMNYVYVGRDLDPLDWVSKGDAAALPGAYAPAHEIVERLVAQARPGSIIPIRVGVPEGGRGDYLFNELALLIDALQAKGYKIVPVSTLMEHAE